MTAVAVSGLVVAGGITFGLVANANLATTCDSAVTSGLITCSITDADQGTTVDTPSAVQAVVTEESGPAQYVLVTWSMYCTEGSDQSTTMNPTTNPPLAIAAEGQVTVNLTFGSTTPTPDSCIVQNVTATLYADSAGDTPSTTGTFSMDLDYTPGSGSSSSSSSTSPPTTHVSTVSGYGGKCVDDRGNSSSNRAQLIIWSCNSSDSAQGWTFSSGELKHNGKCANIQGGGGSGSKLILWSCNGASNEKWFHSSSDGEYVSAGTAHGLECVDDPGYSKTNGTQLIVYKCHNSGNQHWSS